MKSFFLFLAFVFLTGCTSTNVTLNQNIENKKSKQYFITCIKNDVIVFKEPYDRIGYDKQNNLYYIHSESKKRFVVVLSNYTSCRY